MTPPPVLSLDRIEAVIFDTDGVITDPARVHAAAWKSTSTYSTCCRPSPSTPSIWTPASRLGGLHREAYHGHVFWGELFVLPFLTLRFPEIARSLLMYRWRRLPEASGGSTKRPAT
jgi:hypothetical protein